MIATCTLLDNQNVIKSDALLAFFHGQGATEGAKAHGARVGAGGGGGDDDKCWVRRWESRMGQVFLPL